MATATLEVLQNGNTFSVTANLSKKNIIGQISKTLKGEQKGVLLFTDEGVITIPTNVVKNSILIVGD